MRASSRHLALLTVAVACAGLGCIESDLRAAPGGFDPRSSGGADPGSDPSEERASEERASRDVGGGSSPAPRCRAGALAVSTSVGGDMVLCDDLDDQRCEQDFEAQCPLGWQLCTQPQYVARNRGWSYPVSDHKPVLGEIHCREDGEAGHFTLGPYSGLHRLDDDIPPNCGFGSSRADSCVGAHGCNETEALALCCAPTPSCGNGIVDGPEEQCDDGNDDETDACLSNCSWRSPAAEGLVAEGC